MVGPSISTSGSNLQGESRPGYLLLITFVAAMGGLLFGYDWVVIGGAAKFYEAFFQLKDTAAAVSADAGIWEKIWANAISPVGWAQSCALLGCLIGALVSGWFSDRFGRKPILIVAALNFVVSSIGIAMTQSFDVFIAWRILGGVSIGLASTASPMYISEVAPASRRGLLVAINQLTIVIGVLAAQFVNLMIAQPETLQLKEAIASMKGLSGADLEAAKASYQSLLATTWNATDGWRWMFAACAIPSALFFIGSLFVPESPRWLTKAGQNVKAQGILSRIGGGAYAAQAEEEIKATLVNEDKHVKFSELFEKRMLAVLVFGCALAMLQQFCGINVIFNYAGEIFTQAGFNMDDALVSIVATGSVNFLFTFVALFTVDKLGRKPLMVFGFGGLAAIYVVIGYCYQLKGNGTELSPYLFLGLVLAAIAIYAMSLAPVTWVLISEIFPNRIRGTAMSIAVGALWIGCFILTYTFPILKTVLGAAATFWIYAGVCVCGTLVMVFFLKETKGKSLEQIEKDSTSK
jgi:MFS family permease